MTGDLDDSMAELEESRRKLVNLKMQKDVASGMHNLTSGAVNGTLSPEKSTERTISLQELKNSIDETKVFMCCPKLLSWTPPSLSLSITVECFVHMLQILAANRLSELQEAKEENLALSKELQDFQVSDFDIFLFIYFEN